MRFYAEKKNRTLQAEKKSPKSVINIPVIEKAEIKIIFVCAENTCLSPMAEFIMKYLINSAGLSKRVVINSAGCFADPEEVMSPSAVKELHKHQIPFIKKNATQFADTDYDKYDYIICMAQDQIRQLSKGRRGIHFYLLTDFAGDHRNIYEPLSSNKYAEVYSIIYKSCTALLEHVQKCFKRISNAGVAAKKTIFTMPIDEDLLKRFEAALILKDEMFDVTIAKFMESYISEAAKILTGKNSTKHVKNVKAVQQNKNEQNKSSVTDNIENEQDIIDKFIKKCASGISQINQRIIKAYFKSIAIDGKATSDSMKNLCSNQKEYPGLYIYKNNGFDNHYKQMKTNSAIDGKMKKGKSIDGKVFWEDGQDVKILSEVEPFIEKYKSYFL